jgi:hypothetical protein
MTPSASVVATPEVRRELEQVFLRRRSGRYEALAVIERESGARERSTVQLPAEGLEEAARALGRHLARSALADGTRGARVRVERGGTLHDDAALAALLTAAFDEERRRGEDDEP